MTEIEEWKKDLKFVYFSYNLFVSPSWEIIEVKQVQESEVSYHTKDGFYSIERKGIMYCWIDFKKCKHFYGYQILDDVFKFNRNEWLIKKRKEKLKKIIENEI